jgi:membrane-anchored protein YejM (alkaline phosphatase superfamily)
MPRMPRTSSGRGDPVLWLFLLANYALLLLLSTGFVSAGDFGRLVPGLWLAAVLLTYPLLYLLPAFALAWPLRRLGARAARAGRRRLATTLAVVPASLLFAAVQLVIVADRRVHALYGFHLNGFVWNLLTTPGGIAAMGASHAAYATLATLAAVIVAVEAGGLVLLERVGLRSPRLAGLHARRFVVPFLAGLLLVSLSERMAFGASRAAGYTPVLELEDTLPFYVPTSFNHFARRLGFPVVRPETLASGLGKGDLVYPLHPIAFRPGAPRWNVLILCSESLRADALDPELMPATWAFARQNIRFTHHLSAGNGTRMGVFGLFYGLPGPYWFRALNQQQGPVLVDALQDRGWEVRGYTSDDFTYPEFDRTVFADVDRSKLREGGSGKSWQRDRVQTAEILDFLAHRDHARPFFVYAFWESPHARYDFPPESVIRRPYLESFNYVTMDLPRDIHLIQNRYWNSVHHLDSQLARVLDALRTEGLLDSTIVVITGDHGEEFLEHGHWGHKSAFTEQQIHVPLVLHVPGRGPAVIDRMTSHLDLPATVLAALGATNPPADYSLGNDLLGGPARHWTLVSDWNRVAYVDGSGKVAFPMEMPLFHRERVTDRRDLPVGDPGAWMRARTAVFGRVVAALARFTRPPARVATVGP